MKKLFPAAAALGFAALTFALASHFYSAPSGTGSPESRRSEALVKITFDVIEGRRSLLEAAASFHGLCSQSPELAERLAEVYPSNSDAERACNHVIACVRAELDWQSAASEGQQSGEASVNSAAGLIARLEAELKAARGPDGTVVFPESKN
jgi:hypothetical protein